MSLTLRIEEKAKEIKTDSYPMSIGELINMYKDGDLVIFPEYQRYFRWSINQKSHLIESLLLGIPIPPIFVAQNPDGRWDIIDGLQRISTILEFIGILKDSEGDKYAPSQLIGTKFLPELNNKFWDNEDDCDNSISETERRIIKRRKINITIIDNRNNHDAKYELFQRLNTNGSELTDQEVRNCLMVMVDSSFYKKIQKLSEDYIFSKSISLTKRKIVEQYDKELIIRYLVGKSTSLSDINQSEDISEVLTEKLMELVETKDFDIEGELEKLKRVSEIVFNKMEEYSFRKYNEEKSTFEGGFALSLFEVLVFGISDNSEYWEQVSIEEFREKIISVVTSVEFKSATERGRKPVTRFKELIKLSKDEFGSEN